MCVSVTAAPEAPCILHPERCCRTHSLYTSCLRYGTGLWTGCCSHCKGSPPSCSDILWASVFVPLHHPIVASTCSYLKQSACTRGTGNLLLTCLHNNFCEEGVHMAEHGLRHVRCECPPNILDNSAWRHFQYTYDFLEDSKQDISYILNNGKSLLLDQSYKFHTSHSGTASCLYQTGGMYCSNILQIYCYNPHNSVEPAGCFCTLHTALVLL